MRWVYVCARVCMCVSMCVFVCASTCTHCVMYFNYNNNNKTLKRGKMLVTFSGERERESKKLLYPLLSGFCSFVFFFYLYCTNPPIGAVPSASLII